VELTALAGLALAAPNLWRVLWGVYVALMSVLAPALALARVSRTIARGAVEEEFDRWFRPVDSRELRGKQIAVVDPAHWTVAQPHCITEQRNVVELRPDR
jgi:hypothetical protein